MKKQLRNLLLLATALLVGQNAWADTKIVTVATEGELTTAIASVAIGDVIQLTADINLTATIKVTKSIPEFTLDLNGHVLNGSGISVPTEKNNFGCLIYNEGTMTIMDSNSTSTHSAFGLESIKGGVLTGGKGYGDKSKFTTCGGAIVNMKEATMTITGITITGNEVTYVGGGIDNDGTLTLNGTTICKNYTSSTLALGGGICNDATATMTMDKCTISENEASTGGGGIYNTGTANIKNTTISSNSAPLGGGIYSIYKKGYNANLTAENCTIKDNEASSMGGGIYNTDNFNMTSCTISENTASSMGGGIYNNSDLTMNNCTVVKNTSSSSFGGVCHMPSEASNPSTLTLLGKNIIKDNAHVDQYGVADITSNLHLVHVYTNSGALIDDYARLTISGAITDSEIGIRVSKAYFDTNNKMQKDEDTSSPITIADNGAATDLQYFVVDNQDYYKAYNTTGSYLELKKAEFDAASVTKQDLEDIKGQTVNLGFKNRTLFKDGENNSICLPFSLTAKELAESPLAGFSKLQEFSSANIVNKGQDNETLELVMTDATTIEAGKPYIIAWESATDISDVKFTGVTVTTSEAGKSETSNGVTFCGTFLPKKVTANDKGIMFVGKGGKLNWPGVGGNIKGFRCYFTIDPDMNARLFYGMSAFISDEEEETGITSTEAENNVAKARKLIENGRVVIISNGVRYSLDGKRL